MKARLTMRAALVLELPAVARGIVGARAERRHPSRMDTDRET